MCFVIATMGKVPMNIQKVRRSFGINATMSGKLSVVHLNFHVIKKADHGGLLSLCFQITVLYGLHLSEDRLTKLPPHPHLSTSATFTPWAIYQFGT